MSEKLKIRLTVLVLVLFMASLVAGDCASYDATQYFSKEKNGNLRRLFFDKPAYLS
jgi:hypothetical protein